MRSTTAQMPQARHRSAGSSGHHEPSRRTPCRTRFAFSPATTGFTYTSTRRLSRLLTRLAVLRGAGPQPHPLDRPTRRTNDDGHQLVVAKTFRNRLLAVPGRLVRPAGRPRLRLPARWPRAERFVAALGALRALPIVPGSRRSAAGVPQTTTTRRQPTSSLRRWTAHTRSGARRRPPAPQSSIHPSARVVSASPSTGRTPSVDPGSDDGGQATGWTRKSLMRARWSKSRSL